MSVTGPPIDDLYTDHAAVYDANQRGVPGDIELYRDLALEADGLVVEVGVGTGRIALPSVAAGVRMLGLDLSPDMLTICRAKAQSARLELGLVQADMRRFSLRERAALVTIPFRAFLHNLTTEDQLATLRSCFEALEPGGRLALNVFNPDITRIVERLRTGPNDWEDAPSGGLARHEYAPHAQVVESTMLLPGSEGQRRAHIRLRYVYRYELEHLLARAGFTLEHVWGDCERSSFGPLSTEIVCVARR